jgi:hypothetical protein
VTVSHLTANTLLSPVAQRIFAFANNREVIAFAHENSVAWGTV